MPRSSGATTLLLLGALSLAFYYCYRQPTFPTKMSNQGADELLSHLTTAITQSSTSNPSKLDLTITVRNTHPTQSLTFLSWASPLDPLVLQLGLLQLYPVGSDEPLDLPVISVRRLMPPPRDTLVTLAPGESKEQKLDIGEPRVDLDSVFGKSKGQGKARVGLRGEWAAVWRGTAKDVSDESLESMGADAASMGGSFEVRPVEVERPGSGVA